MKKYLMVLCCLFNTVLADEIKQELPESLDKKDSENEQETTNNITEELPDKEFLLFLSEFSDAQDNWIDPEVFNQPYTESINSTVELEETKNEDHPNNL